MFEGISDTLYIYLISCHVCTEDSLLVVSEVGFSRSDGIEEPCAEVLQSCCDYICFVLRTCRPCKSFCKRIVYPDIAVYGIVCHFVVGTNLRKRIFEIVYDVEFSVARVLVVLLVCETVSEYVETLPHILFRFAVRLLLIFVVFLESSYVFHDDFVSVCLRDGELCCQLLCYVVKLLLIYVFCLAKINSHISSYGIFRYFMYGVFSLVSVSQLISHDRHQLPDCLYFRIGDRVFVCLELCLIDIIPLIEISFFITENVVVYPTEPAGVESCVDLCHNF